MADKGTDGVAALDKVLSDAKAKYGEHHAGRLEQLAGAIATAKMALEHLPDEEARRVDNQERREAEIRKQLGQ